VTAAARVDPTSMSKVHNTNVHTAYNILPPTTKNNSSTYKNYTAENKSYMPK
jgi:hypothetical protein